MKTRSSGEATFLGYKEEIQLSKKDRQLVHEAKKFSVPKEEWNEACWIYKMVAPKLYRKSNPKLDEDLRYVLLCTNHAKHHYSKVSRVISLQEACKLFDWMGQHVKKTDQEETKRKREEKKRQNQHQFGDISKNSHVNTSSSSPSAVSSVISAIVSIPNNVMKWLTSK